MKTVQKDSKRRQGINKNHTEHISIGKMLGILDSPMPSYVQRSPKTTGLQNPA